MSLAGTRIASGQSATATLSGSVTDEKGAVVSGATVTVTNVATRSQRQTATSSEGSFSVPLLPPGTYTVRVERDGFATTEANNVVLNVNDVVSLAIQMKVGQVGETITVKSGSLVKQDASVGTVVDRQFVENIPLNGRSFQALIALTPGVVLVPSTTNYNGQFSVNGQRAEANSFSVDGVSANAGASLAFLGSQTGGNLPALTAFGTTQSLASVDAVQEFKVQTSTYSAEYGRQPGGQISILTRSGTNEFHGSVFDYFRNDVLDANNWFANQAGQPRAPMRQNDFGGTFDGPVRLPGYDGRDRTFFFFSFEGLRLREPQFLTTNVPTEALRQSAPAGLQPFLNAFPLPNGKDLGDGLAEFSAGYSNRSSLNATSLRIDHAIGKRLTIFGRLNISPSEVFQRQASNLAEAMTEKVPVKTVTIGATASFTSRLAVDFRFNYSDNKATSSYVQDSFGGAAPFATDLLIPSQYSAPSALGNLFFIFPSITSTTFPGVLVSPGNSIGSQRQFNLIGDISYAAGSHIFKVGVDYRRLTPVYNTNAYALDALFFDQSSVLSGSAPFGYIYSQAESHPLFRNFSVYAQDTWKATPRLTVDAGLRWEINPAPGITGGAYPLAVTEVSDFSSMKLAPQGSSLWKTTYGNFAPRFGIAYQLFRRPGLETVVRGGFGVFFDTGNNNGSGAFVGYPFSPFQSVFGLSFPLNVSQVAPPTLTVAAPYGSIYAYDPSLKLPYTLQWNVAVEQSLGGNQTLTISYVGAAARRLLQQQSFSLSAINPNFTYLLLTTNHATSDYDALQAQFQRRLSSGLQLVASYTWSHAIDDDSSSDTGYVPQRGNAAFDVRHNFAAALTYDLPAPKIGRVAKALLREWEADTTIHAQTAVPLDITGLPIINPATGAQTYVRPNLIPGVPLYIDDPSAPGGRRINAAAFSMPAAGEQGTLGRNVLRGFGAWQVDFALRREFRLTEKIKLQFRAEAFNLFNHPNFGGIQTDLSAANFGEATNLLSQRLGGISELYQIGGPRSIQFALKLSF